MTPNRRMHKSLALLLAGAASLGVGLGAATLASAATETTTTDTVVVVPSNTDSMLPTIDNADLPPLGATGTPPAEGDRPDPASLPNGPGETVLTGDEAAKVTAAAEAAEPGATIIRVETDTSGHTYEAHVQLADGTYKTLYFDASFNADGSEDGFGPGPGGPGHHGHHGQPPADGQTPTDGQMPADGQAPVDTASA